MQHSTTLGPQDDQKPVNPQSHFRHIHEAIVAFDDDEFAEAHLGNENTDSAPEPLSQPYEDGDEYLTLQSIAHYLDMK